MEEGGGVFSYDIILLFYFLHAEEAKISFVILCQFKIIKQNFWQYQLDKPFYNNEILLLICENRITCLKFQINFQNYK